MPSTTKQALPMLCLLLAPLLVIACDDAESCSVDTDADGVVTIACDDGSVATLTPPWDGDFSELPEPCTAEEVDGGAVITCPGADPVTLAGAPGATGPQGATGPPGTGCTLESAEGGASLRITCGEESVLLPGRDADACVVARRDGGVVLLCDEEETPLSTCGNGVVELGQECDLGADNGVCIPDPGTFVCELCTERCELETRTLEAVEYSGLLLHANEGAIGALPALRIETDHGFATTSDEFGRYLLRVPAGVPFTLHVPQQTFMQADFEAGNPDFIILSTAPRWTRMEAPPEEGGDIEEVDIHVITGNERRVSLEEASVEFVAGNRTGSDFFFDPQPPFHIRAISPFNWWQEDRGMAAYSRHILFANALRLPDGSTLPRDADLRGAIIPMGDPLHEEDLMDGEAPISWRGVQRVGLPAGLEGYSVLAATWFGFWTGEGEVVDSVAGALPLLIAAPDIYSEVEPPGTWTLLHFNEASGEWEAQGEVRESFLGWDDPSVRVWDTRVPRFGWYAIVEERDEPTGCVRGRLLLDGQPVSAGVAMWDAFYATSAHADSDGNFCGEGLVGDVSLLSTVLPGDWDRWLGHARTEVETGGSCGDASCVDVGDIELRQLFEQCIPFQITHDEDAPVFQPIGHRYPLTDQPGFRQRYLHEPQWRLARIRTLADRRTCVPLGRTLNPPVILTNDDDIWCPATANGRFLDATNVEPISCSQACVDENLPADGDAFFFCGS